MYVTKPSDAKVTNSPMWDAMMNSAKVVPHDKPQQLTIINIVTKSH